jgi:activator of 2-hydroxyglutaryl-CoA dehydratase
MIMKRFFPAMTSRDNLPITKLLWKYASKLDYRKRYLYYSEWKDENQFTTFLQMARGADLTKVHMRQVFNKLDKESKEKMTMKLAKVTHSQPLLAMNELRRDRAQNSDNNPFMIHALGLVSGSTLDILVFSIVQWINDFVDEKKIKPKDIEYTQWFKNIALFMASFYKKYFNVEM